MYIVHIQQYMTTGISRCKSVLQMYKVYMNGHKGMDIRQIAQSFQLFNFILSEAQLKSVFGIFFMEMWCADKKYKIYYVVSDKMDLQLCEYKKKNLVMCTNSWEVINGPSEVSCAI